MKDSCEIDSCLTLGQKQKKVLWIAFALNLTMFITEAFFGLKTRSSSLLADSIDMGGDAFNYLISIIAVDRTQTFKKRAAFFKGLLIGIWSGDIL